MHNTFEGSGSMPALFPGLGTFIEPIDTDRIKGRSDGLKTFRFELLDNEGQTRLLTAEEWDAYLDAAEPEENEPVKEEAPSEDLDLDSLRQLRQITPLHSMFEIRRINLDSSEEDDRFVDLAIGYTADDGTWIYHTAADYMAWSK